MFLFQYLFYISCHGLVTVSRLGTLGHVRLLRLCDGVVLGNHLGLVLRLVLDFGLGDVLGHHLGLVLGLVLDLGFVHGLVGGLGDVPGHVSCCGDVLSLVLRLVLHLGLGLVLHLRFVDRLGDVPRNVLGLVLCLVLGLVLGLVVSGWDDLGLVYGPVNRNLQRKAREEMKTKQTIVPPSVTRESIVIKNLSRKN